MPTEPQLEAYLNALDKSLGQIPASDRAEIIMEIKSHILDSQENTPDISLSSILNSLGEPETVANRYLLEKGLKVSKPPKTPMVKWLTIGFLGTLSLFVMLFSILLWKFTPIISVDDEKDRVVILGGLIDINGKSGTANAGSRSKSLDDIYATTIEGSKEIGKTTRKISISFSNGSFQFTPNMSQNELKWQCQGGSSGSPTMTEASGTVVVDFRSLEGTNCKIQLPYGIASIVNGRSGQIEILKPKSTLEVQLDNGQIIMSPDVNLEYKYHVQLTHGHADKFVSSTSNKAIEVKMTLKNGYINKEKPNKET